MLKKTMKYVDFKGEERTEDFYFHFSRAEITEMELSIEGGLVAKIEKITQLKDGTEIMALFKEIILGAYGEISADGRRFVKSKEMAEAFSQTPAYSDLFIELCTNPDAAAAFINGIVPSEPNK